ncbi:MAG: Gfo/Idh/MocA family oxidoreductase [Calditrichaeota bacterium]|nr:Gfo/Idh/MocA family oxidoreductase [Calditrichota bacterium]
MEEKIKWGIMGIGGIAHSFAEGLRFVKDAELTAVGSRDAEKARSFAQKFGVKYYHGSYEELVKNDRVRVVYISTPHGRHYEDILLCLEHGKAVLCEKSFTLNAKQAKEVIESARNKNLFLMEAMWTRFLPVMTKVKELLADGVIGEARLLTGGLGFNPTFDPKHRLFDPRLGGGALLDIGVYPIALSQWLFGAPSEMASMAFMGKTGVDEQVSMIFRYRDEKMANLYASLRSITPSETIITGTRGYLRIHGPIYRPAGITISVPGRDDKLIKAQWVGNGYNYEAEEVVRCLREGKTESDIMPLKDTITIMEIMDALRAQWGFLYPNEQ